MTLKFQCKSNHPYARNVWRISHAITGRPMSLPVLIETLKMYLLQRNQEAEIHLEHIC